MDEPQDGGRAPGPAPGLAVAAEVLRAVGDLALLPVRALRYLGEHEALRAELARELEAPHAVDEPATLDLPARPLRLFVSCAEASGETHARSLVRALRAKLAELGAPEPEIVGLGGARLAAENVELVGRPVERAAMGFDVLAAVPYYVRLLARAAERVRAFRPDVFVPIDSPALHVPLARIARRYGVPVVHMIAPQYWGWAPWRIDGYRRAVDRVLTILPFEPAWFERRGVAVTHIGHPSLDAMPPRHGSRSASRRLVLLPGSRASVIERNLPWMLGVVERVRAQLPDVEVVVAHELGELSGSLEGLVRSAGASAWAEVRTGDLHGELSRARAALSVSGTIVIHLLHERLPSVVVYRLKNRRQVRMRDAFLTAPYFASANLLAGREVMPEFSFAGEGPVEDVVASLVRALEDERWRAECVAGLDEAARRLGPPGAAARAAAAALAMVARSAPAPVTLGSRP